MARHCTSCRWFEYTQGEYGYYPGDDADSSMECKRQVWDIDNLTETQETLHAKLTTAETCVEYEVAEFARQEADHA